MDGGGLLATPGLVNAHHHLYQWITRGYAADDTLFGWLTALYPVWAGLDAELVRLGYKDSTMVWYRGCWRRLQRYFAARGAEEFSLEMAMGWVDEACGFFAKEQAGTLKQTDVYLFRVAQMLGDYEAHGAVLRRYSCTVGKLAADEAAAVARFEAGQLGHVGGRQRPADRLGEVFPQLF